MKANYRKVKSLYEVILENKPSRLNQERMVEIMSIYNSVCDNDIILMYFDNPEFFVTRQWIKIQAEDREILIPRPLYIYEYIHLCGIFGQDLEWSDNAWKCFKGL